MSKLRITQESRERSFETRIAKLTINEHVEYNPVTGEKTYIVKDGKPTGKRPKSDLDDALSRRNMRRFLRALGGRL